MGKKLLLTSIIATSILLTGCVSKSDLDASVAKTNSQINALNQRIDSLAAAHGRMDSDIETSAAMAEAAGMEAERANLRIDNIVDSYKK